MTNRGSEKVIMLPYFDKYDEAIDRYMEDYEMWKNRDRLKERYRELKESGLSK